MGKGSKTLISIEFVFSICWFACHINWHVTLSTWYSLQRQALRNSTHGAHGIPHGSVLSPALFNLYMHDIPTPTQANTHFMSLVCCKSDITQNALFFRRSFWKFNSFAITEELEIYLIISISKQCMESCKFPSTYTIISGLLDDVNNSEQHNFQLCHSCSKQAMSYADNLTTPKTWDRCHTTTRLHPHAKPMAHQQ